MMKKHFDIGDLHLCDGTGPFFKNHDKCMRFLVYTVGDDDLTIGGDFLDLWRWSDKEILSGPNRDIIDWITTKPNVTIIIGNHDLDLKLMAAIFQRNVVMGTNVCGFVNIHGHQLDPRLDEPKERKLVRQISLLIQKLDIGLLNRFRDWVTSGPRDNATYKKKFDGIPLLMHHTHAPEITKSYLNPGSWTHDKCQYIVFEDGTPRLKEAL